MAEVVYFDNLAEAQADPALARALGRERQAAPFDRLEWWRDLAELCLPGERPLLAVAREGDSLAALPLMRRPGSGQLRSLATWYSFAAAAVVHGECGSALLARLAVALRGKAHRISLAPLPPETAAELATAFAKAGWSGAAEPSGVNHRLMLGGRSFAEYWAQRPKRLRETVRRKGARADLVFRVSRTLQDTDWQTYCAIYDASWKGEEGSIAFLRRFAEVEAAAGNLRLGIASHRGRPIAAQLWTVEGGAAFIHKLAYDPAAQALSPGTLLSAAMFEHAIDRDRVHTVDYGTGDDAYKRDWMEERRTLFRLDLLDPAQPRAWPHLLRRRLNGLSRRGGMARPRRTEAAAGIPG